MKKLYQLAVSLLALSATFSYAAHDHINPTQDNFECRVVGVLDGDTLDCLISSGQKVRVRLAQIDAPEKSQDFGQRAKKLLSDLTYNKVVILSIENYDKYGRVIAEIFENADDVSVNYKMVKSGMAWAYERYVKDRAYITAQQQAKADKVGLWVQLNPTPPEEYRHKK